jgi:hypothetical protein
VLFAALHTSGRHCQNPVFDFGWQRPDYLARARRCENQELKRAGRNTLVGTQRGHECGQFIIGQGGMMLYTAHLGARRQQLVEVAAPARGILAMAKAACCRPIEHSLDPSAKPRRRFRLLRP